MLNEPIMNDVKKDNGGVLLVSIFVVFFTVATVLGLISNHYEANCQHTCFIPNGSVDPNKCM